LEEFFLFLAMIVFLIVFIIYYVKWDNLNTCKDVPDNCSKQNFQCTSGTTNCNTATGNCMNGTGISTSSPYNCITCPNGKIKFNGYGYYMD
jgi:uncharacterized protein (UPF0333 family)